MKIRLSTTIWAAGMLLGLQGFSQQLATPLSGNPGRLELPASNSGTLRPIAPSTRLSILARGGSNCDTLQSVTATPSQFCLGNPVLLSAISSGDSIRWYDAPSGGNLLGTTGSGSTLPVSPTSTVTYYAEVLPPSSQVTANFTASGLVENFTVPAGVQSITIDAAGAQGGNTNGGKGARMSGTFAVTPGETLGIVVGIQGVVNNCGGGGASGGGGGGTFVWRLSSSASPMIAAGGGGGGNTNWSGSCINGIDASIGPDGTAGNGALSALGGIGGQGGFGNAPSGTGSGGAGWLSSGQNSTYGTGCTGGAMPFAFTGGNGSTNFGPGGEGGFGGGGGAVCGCGGGGGYSGGGGGEGSSCRAGGGGGGSYNAGANPNNQAGFQTGNGYVTITFSGPSCVIPPRVPVTITLDNTAPVANCRNFTVILDQNGTATIPATALDSNSSDNCGITSYQNSQSSFGCNDIGTNVVTMVISDAQGNQDSCSANVEVLGPTLAANFTFTTGGAAFNTPSQTKAPAQMPGHGISVTASQALPLIHRTPTPRKATSPFAS